MASKTITNSAAELLPPNRLRKSFVIQNEDTAINIFIKQERPDGLTVSTTDHDHLLGAGAAIALNNGTDGQEAIQGRWTIIAASGTPRVSYFETEEHLR